MRGECQGHAECLLYWVSIQSMINVIILSVVMPNGIMLNVVVPFSYWNDSNLNFIIITFHQMRGWVKILPLYFFISIKLSYSYLHYNNNIVLIWCMCLIQTSSSLWVKHVGAIYVVKLVSVYVELFSLFEMSDVFLFVFELKLISKFSWI